jgi:hypothetical protein
MAELPLSEANTRVLQRVMRLPFIRTLVKLVLILALFAVLSLVTSEVIEHAPTLHHSLHDVFHSTVCEVLYIVMIVLDCWRGYLQNAQERAEDEDDADSGIVLV